MKAGRTLTELARELERQAKTKRDFVVDSRELVMLNARELSMRGHGEFEATTLAHEQVASQFSIPWKYYQRLQADHPRLLDSNVNTLFHEEPKRRMVRTLDGKARAFLSDRYRRLDNDELMNVVLPVLSEVPDISFPSMDITETHLYLKAVAPRIAAEVKPGDWVQAGVLIKNSEVGHSALAIVRLTFRLACSNGMVTEQAIRRYHVGRQIETEEDAYEIFKDDTLKADDAAFFLKVRDAVGAALNEARFRLVVDRLRLAADTPPMLDISSGVTELSNKYGFSDAEHSSILTHLAIGGDLTQYGAIQAVTRAAADVPSYDRSVELEVVGGRMLEMAAPEWLRLAGVR